MISDLTGVSGSTARFRHDNRDVRLIGFDGLVASDSGLVEITGAPANAWVEYLNEDQENIGGTRAMSGKFLDDGIDGPLAVIGQWSLGGDSKYKAIEGAFGAELAP